MSGLPEIPDAAIEAVMDAMRCRDDIARECIEAAQPHLFAAALRHAADTFQDGSKYDLYAWTMLHKLADEATP